MMSTGCQTASTARRDKPIEPIGDRNGSSRNSEARSAQRPLQEIWIWRIEDTAKRVQATYNLIGKSSTNPATVPLGEQGVAIGPRWDNVFVVAPLSINSTSTAEVTLPVDRLALIPAPAVEARGALVGKVLTEGTHRRVRPSVRRHRVVGEIDHGRVTTDGSAVRKDMLDGALLGLSVQDGRVDDFADKRRRLPREQCLCGKSKESSKIVPDIELVSMVHAKCNGLTAS